MKKLILGGLFITLSGCSSIPSNLTKQDFVGDWFCTTKYENIGVGTVDVIALNADGRVYDENFIFDHSVERFAEKPIKDYFSAPLKYLTINSGDWKFDDNRLTYTLKKQRAMRLIYPNIFSDLQKIKSLKKIESETFKIYSSGIGKEDSIELEITKKTKNGFSAVQLPDRQETQCVRKEKRQERVNFLTALKLIAEKK